MIDKIKTILTIILVVILIFSIGYSIVRVIISAFEKPNLITLENIKEHLLEEKVITSYSTYYNFESCLNNLMQACNKEMYNELYNIYIDDYAKEHTKEQIINSLKNIKSMLTPKDMDEEVKYSLDKLYSVDNQYLARVSINENIVYVVFSEAASKALHYNFAIVK